MYCVEKRESIFNEYVLKDETYGSSAVIAVERGGILKSLVVNGKETIYLNEENFLDTSVAVRGGNPIIFPSCGRLKDKTTVFDGKEYHMEIHGVARSYPWEVVSVNCEKAAELTIALKSNEEIIENAFPFDFELVYTYSLKGNVLTITQKTVNKAKKEMPFTSGLHPYFCADTDKAVVQVSSNAYNYNGTDGDFDGVLYATEDLDHVCGNLTGKTSTLKTGLGYDVVVEYGDEYKYVVVWSPSSDKDFVCVEPWTAKPNALNTKEDLLYLKPGESKDIVVEFKIV